MSAFNARTEFYACVFLKVFRLLACSEFATEDLMSVRHDDDDRLIYLGL